MSQTNTRLLTEPLLSKRPDPLLDFADIHLADFDSSNRRLGVIYSTIRSTDFFVTSYMEQHDYILVSLGTHGEFEWKLNKTPSERIRNRYGLLCMQLANEPTSWRWHGTQTGLTMCIPEQLKGLVVSEMYKGDPEHIQLINHQAFDDPVLYQMSLSLFDASRQPDTAVQFYQESLSLAFIAHAYRHYSSRTPVLPGSSPGQGLSAQQIDTVRDYIHAHFNRKLHLSEIADMMGYTPYYLSRQFRRATGEGVHEFLIRTRIEHARELLLHSDLNVTEIAHSVGFSDHALLSRHFKRLLGVPPRTLSRPGRRNKRAK